MDWTSMDLVDTFDELYELISDLLCLKDFRKKAPINEYRKVTLSVSGWARNLIPVWVGHFLNTPKPQHASFQHVGLQPSVLPANLRMAQTSNLLASNKLETSFLATSLHLSLCSV